jgi:hypothetical protein
MNDLIEKLALESGIALGNNIAEGSRRDLLNKFAELIIKECISAVEDSNDRHRREYFAAKIREHFKEQQ